MEHKTWDLSAFGLHLTAMGLMLCDHLWATIIPGNDWLTCLGRLAYPIFAFLLVEGCCHTRNFRKYLRRMFFCALLSELPFNLMYVSSWIYPFHQNVLWTFLLALLCMNMAERLRKRWNPWLAIPLGVIVTGFFALAAQLAMTDYLGYGVLMVMVFYFFRGNRWYHRLGQLLGLWCISWELMGSMRLPVTLFGTSFEIPQQGFAVLALIPIWCYRGRQGYHSKVTRYCFYLFYPVHMLVLGLMA